MTGINDSQKQLFNYSVDLDRRVRRDNPLWVIREKIDFAWVRDEVAHCYGYNGNESVDPVVILKLLFLLFFDVSVCRACPIRNQCTTARLDAPASRAIVHPDGYELVHQRPCAGNTSEAKRDRRRRMALIEGSFGQVSQNHHFKRARWRRLWRQRI